MSDPANSTTGNPTAADQVPTEPTPSAPAARPSATADRPTASGPQEREEPASSGRSRKDQVRVWIDGARPRTLVAAVVPVAVGTAAARGVEGPLIAWRALAALGVAIALQVATNYANDYSDGKRGADAPDVRSGPTRLVGSGAKPASAVRWAAVAAFATAALIGLSLVIAVGWELALVGVVSIAAGWLYTGGPRPYGYAGLGELFVFLFFGVVATVGSTYVQVEQVTGVSVLASLPVGLLATALLVTNNLRDIPSDSAAGKRTLAVRLGERRTRRMYAATMIASVALVIPVAIARPGALLALAALPMAAAAARRVRSGVRGADLVPVLEATGRVLLVFGVLLTAGLAITPG